MANELTFPRFKAIDGNGDPIRGGKLYTYAEGTSTNKATHSDNARSVAHANPIILNSEGEALIYLTGAYKMNLTTSADGQVPGWPVDNIGPVGGEILAQGFYPDAGATDQGVTGSSNTIKYYVDTIGATNKATIYLRHDGGGEFTDYTFSTSETITSNITLEFEPGARLSIDNAIVVTVNGPLRADLHQIISGSGTVVFASGYVGEVYPQWWGIDGTADETEINLAIDSIATPKCKVIFVGSYTTAAEITADVADIVLEGSGLSTITAPGAINGINVTADDVMVRGLKIVGDDTNGSLGIRTIGNRTIVEDCTVEDFDQGINAFGNGGAAGVGDNAIIRNNRVTQTTIQAGGAPIGILANDSTGSLIEGNTVTMGVWSSGAVVPVGIHTGSVVADSVYNKIIGNTVYDGFDCIQFRGVRNIITGNTLDGGIEAGIITNGTSATQHSGENTITGNVLKDCGRYGIGCVVAEFGYGLLISNNVLKDCGTRSDGTDSGITLNSQSKNNVAHISVMGNYIEGGKTGVYVVNATGFALENISIIGNSIADCTVEGIQISRADNITVMGNNIHNCTTYGINVTGTEGANLVVMGNVLNSNGTNLVSANPTSQTYHILDNPGSEETITADAQTLQPWGYSELDSNAQKVDSTLGNGMYTGGIKTIVMTDASNSSTLTITNHQTSDPEVATFNAVDETGVFMWTGTEWVTIFATCTFV